MKKMRLCTVCGEYTLKASHCGRESVSAHPAAFNPNDRFGEYRRKMKGIGI